MSSAETQKLLLPVPGQLTTEPGSDRRTAPDVSSLNAFLSRGLDNADAVQGWVNENYPDGVHRDPVPDSRHLTERQKIYDQYFRVQRHDGGIDSIKAWRAG